jgi:hypothetical protein
MSKPKEICVKESVPALKKLLSKRSATISQRLQMLILIKNNEGTNMSKITLGKLLALVAAVFKFGANCTKKAACRSF